MLGDVARLFGDFAGAGVEAIVGRLGADHLQRIAPRAPRELPVLTLPGFMADDSSLARLDAFLCQQGFVAQSWGLGRNRGPQSGASWKQHFEHLVSSVTPRVRRLADRCGAPVALVGHSLGGVYARELASRLPKDIDRVITLGSPTIHPYKKERHNKVVRAASHWVNRDNISRFGGERGLLHWVADDPALPCVAIHSPIDGLVHEDACHIPAYIVARSGRRAPRENVRVLASHVGMPMSPWVLLAVADRLLAERRAWRAFDPFAYFPGSPRRLVRAFYPSGESFRRDAGAAAFIESNQ